MRTDRLFDSEESTVAGPVLDLLDSTELKDVDRTARLGDGRVLLESRVLSLPNLRKQRICQSRETS